MYILIRILWVSLCDQNDKYHKYFLINYFKKCTYYVAVQVILFVKI